VAQSQHLEEYRSDTCRPLDGSSTSEVPKGGTIDPGEAPVVAACRQNGDVISSLANASPARILVVQPAQADPLERWLPWLRDRGVAVRTVRPFAGDDVPVELDEDGLIVLGGAMSIHDTDDHPWLHDVSALLRNAVERELPTLGICLGGQLLAGSLGGVVARGSAGVEAGVADVQMRPEADDDALLSGLGRFYVGSMHDDAVHELPEGSCWLAASDLYPHQAFRVGVAAWGVQFHPEISPMTYETWASIYDNPEPVSRQRVLDGISKFSEHDAEVRAASRAIADRFAHLVLAARSVQAT
jgi:GMP synthase (glutamine-hydrolysing)